MLVFLLISVEPAFYARLLVARFIPPIFGHLAEIPQQGA